MCNLFLNILEHVEHHGEQVEHVRSVQHVEVSVDQNFIVHDLALLGKKHECYVLLVNEILVIVKKKKKSMPI